MVYRTIIDVILHLFIICNDLWCQLPFFSQTFRHNGSAVFVTMPPMCLSCPDVNKLRGMDTTILGQHRPFMSIKSFVQHSGWQEMVSLSSLIRLTCLIGVCPDRDQPEFLCSCSDSRHLEVHVATAGGWLTCYRPREVRNSIYRYRKIHIDYRSKFLYRFMSPISIIYGNTSHNIPCKVAEVYYLAAANCITYLLYRYLVLNKQNDFVQSLTDRIWSIDISHMVIGFYEMSKVWHSRLQRIQLNSPRQKLYKTKQKHFYKQTSADFFQ